MKKLTPLSLIKDPGHLLSFGLGSGLVPKAPGTFGTLAAVPLYYLYASTTPIWVHGLIILLSFLLGIVLCGRTAHALKVHDHPAIVWDEFTGFFITMFMVPPDLINLVLGFALFRLFDIVKPWPVSVIDSRLRGGLGVMLDDVLAGIYALICLHILMRLINYV